MTRHSPIANRRAAAILPAILLWPSVARACAVCYGEPDSPAAKGLTWAIIALAAIVGVVLGCIVAFFVHASKTENAREGMK
jgi:heme/copper-type cytochrome/quinol oxidase subunit 2